MTDSLNLSEMRPPGFLRQVQEVEISKQDAVSKGGGWIVNEKCILCGGLARALEFVAYGTQIFRCLDCTIRYVERMPRNLADVYSGEEYLQQAKTAYLTNVDYRVQRFATERVNLIRQFLAPSDHTSLLDIGCGTGWFLGYAKSVGFSVSGYEFSPELVRFTSQQIGCEVYSGALKEIPGKFDAITLFDVVEHVPEPAELIAILRDYLTERGIILMYTPNFDSIGISVMRDRSNLIVPSRHLTYFNRQSIDVLADLAGMRVDWFETAGIDIGDIKSLSEHVEGRAFNNEVWQQLSDSVQPVIDKTGLGNHLRAILRHKVDR